jgi:predicted membrane-bound spermidine synthase
VGSSDPQAAGDEGQGGAPATPLRRLDVAFLLSTSVIGGAAIMAAELLGARMLSPVYGGSLTVWAAMISVTMLSLAAGYFVGGWIADRRPRPGMLYAGLLLAAALVGVCPHMRFVLGGCYRALGLKAGALSASALIFFLPLAIMGTISPAVIRLLASGRRVGVTAGGVYAISTIGSVAGTLLTGLWLIPRFGTATGFRLTACVLAATGALGLLTRLKLKGAAALPVLLGLALLPAPAARVGETYVAPDGDRVRVVALRDSAHGRIAVLEKGAYNLLVVGGIVQTGIPRNLSRLQKADSLAVGYYQELLPYTVPAPEKTSALLVGLAGGMTASMLKLYEMKIDAVDLDPEIIDVARKHFSFTGPAVAADGRRFLEDCREKYDFCVIDTYSGDVFPFHLASKEAFVAAKDVLKEKGILCINYIGSPKGRAFACVYRTLSEVFPHLHAIRGEPGDRVQTITIFASDRKIEFNGGWWDYRGGGAGAIDPIGEAIDRLSFKPELGGAFVLTDDYNPIDFLRGDEALQWRERTRRAIGSGVGL